MAFTLRLAVVDPASPRDKYCGKLVLYRCLAEETEMSIRLRMEPRFHSASGLLAAPAPNWLAIGKNCGEIEKKYWTGTRKGFTLDFESFA
jgi:hypothetical protein